MSHIHFLNNTLPIQGKWLTTLKLRGNFYLAMTNKGNLLPIGFAAVIPVRKLLLCFRPTQV